MSSTYKKGVFSHEMGRGMGLAHVTDTKQIMCTSADGRAVFKPGSDDIAGINHLYKNGGIQDLTQIEELVNAEDTKK